MHINGLNLNKTTFMLKQTFITASFIFIFSFSFSQELEQQSLSQEVKIETSGLSYHKEIPDTNSYKIVKNTTGEGLPKEILEEINFHRRHNEDFHWIVDNQIEIYIYKFQ